MPIFESQDQALDTKNYPVVDAVGEENRRDRMIWCALEFTSCPESPLSQLA